MRRDVLHIVFACGMAFGILMLVTVAHTETPKQEMDGIFDRARFTYEGKPRHTHSIAGDEVVKEDIPPAIAEAFGGAGGSSLFDKAKLEVGLYGDTQTKAVTVDLTPPKILRHYGDASSPIAQGYTAKWVVDWMWATSDVTAGVAGRIEGAVYQDGEAKRFQIPLLIEAEASADEADHEGRSYYPFAATIRWGKVRWVDVEQHTQAEKKRDGE